MGIGTLLVIAAVVCFVVAAWMGKSVLALGLALWAGSQLVGQL